MVTDAKAPPADGGNFEDKVKALFGMGSPLVLIDGTVVKDSDCTSVRIVGLASAAFVGYLLHRNGYPAYMYLGGGLAAGNVGMIVAGRAMED